MKKEQLLTSTQEVPKHKPALLDKIQAEKKPEHAGQLLDFGKAQLTLYHFQPLFF